MYNINQLKLFSDKEFKEFCQYIYDNVGIKLTEKKINLVHNRLRKRLLQYNLTSYGEYFKFVKGPKGKEEFVNLVNAITTNVTTFFRDPKQFQSFSQLVLPYYESSIRKLNIWSAGCSTGEEPYSIAIEILKYTKSLNFQIIATDISTKVLELGEQGIYSYDQIKTIEPHYLNSFFRPKNENYEIIPSIKKYITFKKLNLIEDSFPKDLDIIFCRNVVIYFDKETKDKLYQNFHRSLNKDGFLFVGHSESLFSNTLFRFFKPSIYKKVPVNLIKG